MVSDMFTKIVEDVFHAEWQVTIIYILINDIYIAQ